MKETMHYDPNLVSDGKMASQTVRLTFGMWDYRAEKEAVIGGNCLGLDVIETAVEDVYERLPESKHGEKELVLENGEGFAICRDCARAGDDWLKNMLVKAEIVKIEEEKC